MLARKHAAQYGNSGKRGFTNSTAASTSSSFVLGRRTRTHTANETHTPLPNNSQEKYVQRIKLAATQCDTEQNVNKNPPCGGGNGSCGGSIKTFGARNSSDHTSAVKECLLTVEKLPALARPSRS